MMELLSAALETVGKLLGKMPNYEQKKKQEYMDLLLEFNREVDRETGEVNTQRLGELQSKLEVYMKQL